MLLIKKGNPMCLFKWMDSQIKKFNWVDISFIKMAVFAFTLMLVKFFPQLLLLEWKWYLIIAIICAIRPWSTILSKKK